MREKVLNNLNNAIQWNVDLQPFDAYLPQNLMDGAASAYQDNIPNAVNQILNLLNSVSGYNRFENINNIFEAKALFENESVELDEAFNLVPENKNIIGFAGGNNFSAEQLLNDMYFWLNSHCDTINITLTAGRLTAEHKNR